MRTTQYVNQERAIAAAEGNSIRQRWLYGLRLLRDPQAMSPRGGGLKHGVAAELIAAAKAKGIRLSEREVQLRLQCARAYPTEAQIRTASADFATWTDLRSAGFPAYEAPPDEPIADHRTPAEKRRDANRRLLEAVGEQGTLFPLDQFEPVETPLKDLIAYADEQDEITERFVEHGRKRREYLDALREAVEDDLSVTWQEAHQAAFGEGPDA